VVIDAADAGGSWEPSSLADVFGTLREQPDVIAAVAEYLTVTAAAAEDAVAVKTIYTSALEEAAARVAQAGAALGEFYAREPWLRSDAPRWLPPGRGAA
jgi:hypothetical protein